MKWNLRICFSSVLYIYAERELEKYIMAQFCFDRTVHLCSVIVISCSSCKVNEDETHWQNRVPILKREESQINNSGWGERLKNGIYIKFPDGKILGRSSGIIIKLVQILWNIESPTSLLFIDICKRHILRTFCLSAIPIK